MARLVIENIPDDLFAEFKAACARQRKPMRETIIEFMQQSVPATVIVKDMTEEPEKGFVKVFSYETPAPKAKKGGKK